MATKVEEREWIAMHLYEEHRFERTLVNRRNRDIPMWHELDHAATDEWMHKAARLQAWLVTCRRFHRSSA